MSTTKAAGKSAGKSAGRKAVRAGSAAAKRTPPAAAERPAEPTAAAVPAGDKAKHKLVRDSFTIPKAEVTAMEALKRRGNALGHPVKKSELLRAGLKLLDGLADAELLAALKAVPALKTGRPKQSTHDRLAELTE